MRSFLALGLLITLCSFASATTHHSRKLHPVFVPPSAASSFAAFPGWDIPSYDDPSRFGGGSDPSIPRGLPVQ
jgi:hypothetical protein